MDAVIRSIDAGFACTEHFFCPEERNLPYHDYLALSVLRQLSPYGTFWSDDPFPVPGPIESFYGVNLVSIYFLAKTKKPIYGLVPLITLTACTFLDPKKTSFEKKIIAITLVASAALFYLSNYYEKAVFLKRLSYLFNRGLYTMARIYVLYHHTLGSYSLNDSEHFCDTLYYSYSLVGQLP